MLATLTGDLCLLAGLAVLLLPLLATELSRPRDGAWGAIILLLGLVLVTSSDRLRGAPMLGVACAGLLISRLGAEVGQARWQQLSDEERQRLGSRERWTTSLQQLTTVLASLGSATADTLKSLKPAAKTGTNKRWVRPDESSTGADLDAPAGGEIKETTGTAEKKEANNNDDSSGNGDSRGNSNSSGDSDSNDAVTPEAQVTTPKRPKRWVRPDSPEPSLEDQEAPSPSNSDESPDEALNETSAEASTDRSEDGSEDTASNTARTDED